MDKVIPIFIAAVAIATMLNVTLKRFGMPTVVGYIFTGIIIGFGFNVKLQGNVQLEQIAEFGVVFLMFTTGLEVSFSHLKSMTKEVFLFGGLQLLLTGIVLAVLAEQVLHIGYKSAIIIAAGMALSSSTIVLKLLNESGKNKSEFGRNSLGILIFQDIAVIPILLMITIFTNQDKSVVVLLTDTAINAVIVLGILVVSGKYAFEYLFKSVSNTNSKEIYMGLIFFIVVSTSYIAQYFGFSYSLGAFIAGMIIADTIYRYQVEADLIPFRDLLLGVYFVTVGLMIDSVLVINNIGWILLLTFVVMAIKIVIMILFLSIAGNKKPAIQTALTLSQISEFTLVVFSLLLANNLLAPTLVQIFMATIIVSMVVTPFIMNNTDRVIDWFIKKSITETRIGESGTTGGRVILCGYGSFGEAVSGKLNSANINHTIITNNTEGYGRAKEAGENVVFGDAADRVLLENLHIREAMSTVIATEDFEKVKQITAAITLIDPELKVIARVANEDDKAELTEFNHELLLDGNNLTATLLVNQISRSRLLAIETSSLEHLCNYSAKEPGEAISLVTLEQARLLDIISKSFNGLREEKDIMHIKALHDSFDVLSEIIGNAIADIIKNASLSSLEYEKIYTLLDNQSHLISMNKALVELAHNLKNLEKSDQTNKFSLRLVEALDAILMSLKDIANDYNDEDLLILKALTSDEGGGTSKILKAYLGDEKNLDQFTKAQLLSSMTNMGQLKQLFGKIGANYQRLG